MRSLRTAESKSLKEAPPKQAYLDSRQRQGARLSAHTGSVGRCDAGHRRT